MRAKLVGAGVAVVVLALYAWLVSRPPTWGITKPQTSVAVPLGREVKAGSFEVSLTRTNGPLHVGRNTFAVWLHRNGNGASDSTVTVVCSQPSGPGPAAHVPMRFGDGHFEGTAYLQGTGPWEADVYISEPRRTQRLGLGRVYRYTGAASYTFTVDH
jgi:hypothetical protein